MVLPWPLFNNTDFTIRENFGLEGWTPNMEVGRDWVATIHLK